MKTCSHTPPTFTTTTPEPWLTLDHDTLRTIFTFLSGPDIQASLRTCKPWSALASDDALWRALVRNAWSGLPTSGVTSWKDRYVSLWGAENALPPPTNDDAFTLAKLNGEYKFITIVKDKSGERVATGTAPVELKPVEAYVGPAMGGPGSVYDNGILICSEFEEPFDLPSELMDYSSYINQPPQPAPVWNVSAMERVRLDMHIHVARTSDAKIAHFLSCSLVQPMDEGDDGEWYGQAEAIGVGAPFLQWGYRQARIRPSWLSLMKHALPDGSAEGEMNGEISMVVDAAPEDPSKTMDTTKDNNPIKTKPLSMELNFGKEIYLGEGGFAPCFRTSLILPDMPAILAALSWK